MRASVRSDAFVMHEPPDLSSHDLDLIEEGRLLLPVVSTISHGIVSCTRRRPRRSEAHEFRGGCRTNRCCLPRLRESRDGSELSGL